MKISAALITRNEEKNIADCIGSLSFCDEIIIVDSFSRDDTCAIARNLRAKVSQREFKDFASQKNFAISLASHPWVFLVDADERVPEELAKEIRKELAAPTAECYWLRRENNIFGRWMKQGQSRQDYQLRLIQKKDAHFEGVVHERLCPIGRSKKLKNPLLHYSTRTVAQYMQKLNHYTTLESRAVSGEAKIGRTSLSVRPLAVFFRMIFIQESWRDGLEGFMFTVLSAYYEFIKLAKTWELRSKV